MLKDALTLTGPDQSWSQEGSWSLALRFRQATVSPLFVRVLNSLLLKPNTYTYTQRYEIAYL